MDRRLPRVLAVLTAALLLAALATVPANGAEPSTRSTVSDATTGPADADRLALPPAALQLIDPGAAGAGFSAQPACNWGPGRPAGSGAPAMCVHADRPPVGACGAAMAGLASVGLLAVPALVLLTPALVLANNPYCPA